jgi:hypothetical protein
MKRGYSKEIFNHRSKVGTIFYAIKKTMPDDIRSVRTKAHNNEMGSG